MRRGRGESSEGHSVPGILSVSELTKNIWVQLFSGLIMAGVMGWWWIGVQKGCRRRGRNGYPRLNTVII